MNINEIISWILINEMLLLLYLSVDTMVCTGCCATLDHITTFLHKRLSKTNKNRPNSSQENDGFPRIMEVPPEILQQVSIVESREKVHFIRSLPSIHQVSDEIKHVVYYVIMNIVHRALEE